MGNGETVNSRSRIGCVVGGAILIVWVIAIGAVFSVLWSAISCRATDGCESGATVPTLLLILFVAVVLTLLLGLAFGRARAWDAHDTWVRRVRKQYPAEVDAALRELDRLERPPGDPETWVVAACERMQSGVPPDVADVSEAPERDD